MNNDAHDLEEADRQIAQDRKRVLDQRMTVAQLVRDGSDAATAKVLLFELECALLELIDRRNSLARKVKGEVDWP